MGFGSDVRREMFRFRVVRNSLRFRVSESHAALRVVGIFGINFVLQSELTPILKCGL